MCLPVTLITHVHPLFVHKISLSIIKAWVPCFEKIALMCKLFIPTLEFKSGVYGQAKIIIHVSKEQLISVSINIYVNKYVDLSIEVEFFTNFVIDFFVKNYRGHIKK